MDKDEKDLTYEIHKWLKKEYKDIERIEKEDEGVLLIYALDETLWKIFEDNMGKLKGIEFEAGVDEPHYLRIIV